MTGGRIVALSGGVGGAKLALGLARTLPADRLTVVTNTADDFVHMGLRICPDIDTVVYTLSGLADPERGWGRRDETWNFMKAIGEIGGEDWFNLGDGDLAMHVFRTGRLFAGIGLTEVTAEICGRLGIGPTVLPMTDDPVSTVVLTADGPLPFQHYFVRDRCEPAVLGFRFDGIERAVPNPALTQALSTAGEVDAVIVTPSNPFVSIDPILALPDLRQALVDSGRPIVAVSPIVGGQAIKGPTAKMMGELGLPTAAAAVARHYEGLIHGIVIDEADAAQEGDIRDIGIEVMVTDTVMRSLADREALARQCCEFAEEIAR